MGDFDDLLGDVFGHPGGEDPQGDKPQPTFDPYEVMCKLPLEAQRLLLKILSTNDPVDHRTSRKVKDVCSRYRNELEAFGLVAEFYAYALIYWAMNQPPQAIRKAYDNLKPAKARDLFGQSGESGHGGNPQWN